MFYFIDNNENDPYYNLALEQVAFDRLDKAHGYCMLWQNRSSVIVGRHQNTAAEIDASFADSHGITVVRRLSGGGAVYHDLGNINFTFITDANASGEIDFAGFFKPVKEALVSFGVPAEISGRNDMTVDGKKISGGAMYIKQNRVLYHGTILYDTDLTMLGRALSASKKFNSGGIKSVPAKVTNIRPYMGTDMPAEKFIPALRESLISGLAMEVYPLTAGDKEAAKTLRDQVYSKWDWNYGASPPYNVRKSVRLEGCGTVEVLIDVAKEGLISGIAFYGDFFGKGEPESLAALLTGHRLERGELSAVLNDVDISHYFHNMGKDAFLSLLIE
jgi:lipoate-protein ligase A